MMSYGSGYGGGYGNMMGGGFGGVAMLLFSVLFLAGVTLLVVWAIRASSGGHGSYGSVSQPPGQAGHDEAVAIAKRRFASGEITREQYDEIMRGLGA